MATTIANADEFVFVFFLNHTFNSVQCCVVSILYRNCSKNVIYRQFAVFVTKCLFLASKMINPIFDSNE